MEELVKIELLPRKVKRDSLYCTLAILESNLEFRYKSMVLNSSLVNYSSKEVREMLMDPIEEYQGDNILHLAIANSCNHNQDSNCMEMIPLLFSHARIFSQNKKSNGDEEVQMMDELQEIFAHNGVDFQYSNNDLEKQREKYRILNFRNKNGDTPLHIAIQNLNVEAVAFLLDLGADTHSKNNSCKKPYHYLKLRNSLPNKTAAEIGKIQSIESLLLKFEKDGVQKNHHFEMLEKIKEITIIVEPKFSSVILSMAISSNNLNVLKRVVDPSQLPAIQINDLIEDYIKISDDVSGLKWILESANKKIEKDQFIILITLAAKYVKTNIFQFLYEIWPEDYKKAIDSTEIKSSCKSLKIAEYSYIIGEEGSNCFLAIVALMSKSNEIFNLLWHKIEESDHIGKIRDLTILLAFDSNNLNAIEFISNEIKVSSYCYHTLLGQRMKKWSGL